MKRILVPWDGSESSNEALRMAAGLASKASSTLEVLYIIPSSTEWKGPLDNPTVACSIARVEDFEKCIADTSALLNRVTSITAQTGTSPMVTVKVGNPVKQIVAHASATKPSLIVMGTRGLGRWKGLFLGSVSNRLIHSAPCPVLLVNQARKIDTILVAVDDSSASRNAVMWIASLAGATGAKVTLLAVDRVVPTILPVPGEYEVVNLHTGVLAKQALQSCRQAAQEAGLAVREIEEAGDPTERILAVAAKGEYDLVVLGSHGRSEMEDLFTGGTGDRVAHMAERPVLIVR
ncbi:MAG: universal stress protein [Nitrospirota bacterium]|nr:universal stress protein [Nitrospirota bacterium]